jgi:hypothetical protein
LLREEGWTETGPTAGASRCRWENVRQRWERGVFANVRPKITVDLGDQRRYCGADVLSMSTDRYNTYSEEHGHAARASPPLLNAVRERVSPRPCTVQREAAAPHPLITPPHGEGQLSASSFFRSHAGPSEADTTRRRPDGSVEASSPTLRRAMTMRTKRCRSLAVTMVLTSMLVVLFGMQTATSVDAAPGDPTVRARTPGNRVLARALATGAIRTTAVLGAPAGRAASLWGTRPAGRRRARDP